MSRLFGRGFASIPRKSEMMGFSITVDFREKTFYLFYTLAPAGIAGVYGDGH